MLPSRNTIPQSAMIGIDKIFVCFLFVWVEALRPCQQFFSHVGTEPPLLVYYQYLLRRY